MKSSHKRILFFSLILFFFLYTYAIYTEGTSTDFGEKYLNHNAKKGKLLFQEYNCTSCHQLYGLGGYMGPDLTNVISAKNKGSEYAKAFIKSGTQRMPNFHLNENEIDELIAYLTYVDKTGVSPVINFTINYNGTINQEERK